MQNQVIIAAFQGSTHSVPLDAERRSVKYLVERVAALLGLVNVKLVLKGGTMVTAASSLTLQEAGLKAGSRVMVVGSRDEDIERVRNSRDLPGMAGFDQELRRLAARRKRDNNHVVQLPSGPYTFDSYEAWNQPGLNPPPSEAVKLLHKLAADPGIVDVMKQNYWRVGKLSEMPPEGKEGISPVCILGVNINAGQEISLRLRTDDLQGFRRYQSIRDTLCHELAHMVFGEHDNKFKTLNSQIRSHVDRMTQSVSAKLFQAAEGWELDVPSDPQDVMGVTASSSGRTLRQLAEESAVGVQALGHRDQQTELKEQAAEQLSTPSSGSPLVHATSDQHQTNQPQVHERSRPVSTLPLPSETAQPSELSRSVGAPLKMSPASADQSGAEQSNQSPQEPNTAEAREQQSKQKDAATRDLQAQGTCQPAENLEGLRERTASPMPVASRVSSHSEQDASVSYLTHAMDAVNTILQSAEQQSAILGLTTLLTILKNALENPGDPKFRRIKFQNPTFQQRAGRLRGSLALLESAGFVLRGESGEQVLRLEREDPGLLWLTLTACEQGLQRVSAR